MNPPLEIFILGDARYKKSITFEFKFLYFEDVVKINKKNLSVTGWCTKFGFSISLSVNQNRTCTHITYIV